MCTLKTLFCTADTISVKDEILHERTPLISHKNYRKYGTQPIEEKHQISLIMPKLSQCYILRREDPILIESNTVIFGEECVRLVKVAFHASQMFPTMMGTCDTVSNYLRKGLIQRHSGRNFHIIISENYGFGFAIDGFDHFADIKQEQYRVLIFSTKFHKKVKFDTHDANNQMKLHWKSVVIKEIDD